VRAGEAGGVLEDVLGRLAEFMAKAERVKNQIKGAMVYPIVVLAVASTILIFMMTFIIPKFADVFVDLMDGAPLPRLTLFVMGISDGLIANGHFMVLGIVAFVACCKCAGRTTRGRYLVDLMKLKMPLFGTLFQLTAVAHFGRTLGTLLNSGVPILQALSIVSDTAGNAVVSKAIMRVHDSVKEGESMALPMDESGAFPLMAVSMVEVGEETGALPEMLSKVAETYEEDVDIAVAALTSAIEPIMIVGLAVVVGTIVIAMFLPLTTILNRF
jgi:type IV pilus assembly protein PilC